MVALPLLVLGVGLADDVNPPPTSHNLARLAHPLDRCFDAHDLPLESQTCAFSSCLWTRSASVSQPREVGIRRRGTMEDAQSSQRHRQC